MAAPFTQNISNRTVDLAIFDEVKGQDGKQAVRLGFTPGGGQATAGIQRLAEYFTAIFLTETGTDPYDLTYGTDFVIAARTGSIRTDPDVLLYFNLAVNSIRKYFLRNQDIANLPPDEIFSDAGLTSFSLIKNGPAGDNRYPLLQMQVTLRSAATEELEIPIGVTVI